MTPILTRLNCKFIEIQAGIAFVRGAFFDVIHSSESQTNLVFYAQFDILSNILLFWEEKINPCFHQLGVVVKPLDVAVVAAEAPILSKFHNRGRFFEERHRTSSTSCSTEHQPKSPGPSTG